MQFRQKALAKLHSPEDLDIPVRLARPQGRLVLAVTAVFMAVACFWVVTGSMPSRLSAPGILTHAQGSHVLQSPVSGQVTAVLVREGEMLPVGAALLSVLTGQQKTETVRTVAAGRVTALTARIGAVVAVGADVALLERVDRADDPLFALLYVPERSASTIPVGAAVDLTVRSVPARQFGVLRGHVKDVGRTPVTRQQITLLLGDDQLGQRFSAQGQPVVVVVELDRSDRTKSGYVWSSADGPPYPVGSMALVGATVRLPAQHPIDWILP